MSENTTDGGNANNRRQFLQAATVAAGAALLSPSLPALAATPTSTPPSAELKLAVELLTQGNFNNESGLLLHIVEHGNAQDVASVIRSLAQPADLDTLRRATRETLAAWSADTAA